MSNIIVTDPVSIQGTESFVYRDLMEIGNTQNIFFTEQKNITNFKEEMLEKRFKMVTPLCVSRDVMC